jgi:hypothetical protein
VIDFSRILTSFSCFGNSRIPDLYATVLNVLANTTDNKVVVNINTKDLSAETSDRLALLAAMARHTGNTFQVNTFEESVSLGQMYHYMLVDQQAQDGLVDKSAKIRRYWLSIDDDLFVPTVTLDLLAQASESFLYNQDFAPDLFLFGFFEVINYRNYQDWYPEPLDWSSMLEAEKQYGQKHLLHRLYEPAYLLTLKEFPGQHCGAFMIDLPKLIQKRWVLDHLKQWAKGQRGVDVYICKSAESPRWIYGSNAYHTDRTKAHIDNTIWSKDVEGGKPWLA